MKSLLREDILACHRQGMTVVEISESLEVEQVLVKSVLLSAGQELGDSEDSVEGLVSKEEVKEFIEGYKSIARFAENEGIREKALKNLVNLGMNVTDGLGENNVREIMKNAGANCNILQLNAILVGAREAKKMAIENVKKMITPVEDKDIANDI